MSFILDALKKSEHKRRSQAGEESAALYDPSEIKPAQRRQAMQLLMIFLLLGILLLLVVLVWQRPWNTMDSAELPVTVVAEQPAAAPGVQGQVEIPAAVTQSQEDVGLSPQTPLDEPRGAVVAVPAPSPVVAQPTPAPVTTLPAVPVASVDPELFPTDHVYSISDLPADVRRRLPALQMALHAYNAADADASLVQINGRLVREGAQIAEDLSVDKITNDGAVLRSGNYRFLLPRRGQ